MSEYRAQRRTAAKFLCRQALSAFLLGLLLAGLPLTSVAQNFELVVRAFIPNEHEGTPGFVRPRPGQPGRSMIPGPGIPYVISPTPLAGSCYNTNDRGFSSASDASAKASSIFRFSLVNGVFDRGTVQHDVDKTQQFDCESGMVTCEAFADKSTITALPATRMGDFININLAAKASNPCVSAPSQVVPGITWSGMITIDSRNQKVRYNGTISDFPSFEVYLRVDGGPPITLLNEKPAAGSTAWSLLTERSIDKEVGYFALEGAWAYSTSGLITFQGSTATVHRTHCGALQKLNLPFQRLAQGAKITIPTSNGTFPCGRPPLLRQNMIAASSGHPTVYEIDASSGMVKVVKRQPGFTWDANSKITSVYYMAPTVWTATRK